MWTANHNQVRSRPMRVSVVVSTFNEAKGLKRFRETLLSPVVEHLSYDYEIVHINDGSTRQS